MIAKIALASLKNRRTSVLLTLISIIISVSLLLGVEFIRGQIKQSFTRTVSGVDLIVGAPTGNLNLLLYSVFRIGNATNGISWEQVEKLDDHALVDWVIPVSLGDSHKGFRVVGTDNRYFTHYQYGNQQSLELSSGSTFTGDMSAVIGSEVAKSLGYTVGDELVISHGLGNVSFKQHEQHPFTITGILAATGTPIDKAVHVTLHGVEAMHEKASSGSSVRSMRIRKPADQDGPPSSRAGADTNQGAHQHEPEQVTAIFVGLTSRAAALQLQYQLNQKNDEPVLAILPGMALSQLWQLMGGVEKLLLGISVLILAASLIGLITMLLATMRERRHEIAVLRAMGAGPLAILWLIQTEALLVALVGCIAALGIDSVLFVSLASVLSEKFGLFISGTLLTGNSAVIIGSVLIATWLCSFVPALAAYRQALHAGLSQR
ncbi:ABC transporter permease [Salinimonas sp. HHU 13199]|uniref:ABC transporter permease n=1 Tax=Salinimonas profundi TaxID=2729140 RepID=A0ABR8LII4_9ALTE|nr:ABC transporter permease [Salinimonas profundi]MBD3585562.1 ABC transporter permease [Salinimonas profundi]